MPTFIYSAIAGWALALLLTLVVEWLAERQRRHKKGFAKGGNYCQIFKTPRRIQ
jgi:hypothetical protein